MSYSCVMNVLMPITLCNRARVNTFGEEDSMSCRGVLVSWKGRNIDIAMMSFFEKDSRESDHEPLITRDFCSFFAIVGTFVVSLLFGKFTGTMTEGV